MHLREERATRRNEKKVCHQFVPLVFLLAAHNENPTDDGRHILSVSVNMRLFTIVICNLGSVKVVREESIRGHHRRDTFRERYVQ